jgi:hypothetical protein
MFENARETARSETWNIMARIRWSQARVDGIHQRSRAGVLPARADLVRHIAEGDPAFRITETERPADAEMAER